MYALISSEDERLMQVALEQIPYGAVRLLRLHGGVWKSHASMRGAGAQDGTPIHNVLHPLAEGLAAASQ